MKRAAILLLLFVALFLTFTGQALSAFAIWLIESAGRIIGYAKDIEP